MMLLIDSSAVLLAWASLSWKAFLMFFSHRPERRERQKAREKGVSSLQH